MPERKGSESSPSTCVRGCCRSYSFPLAIPKSDIQMVAEIARGVESVVCEARFGGKSVAAKNSRLSTTDDMNRFHTELQMLGKLNRPNLATWIGARAYPPDYYFLYELYEHGNLGDALHVSDWRQVMTMGTQLGYAILLLFLSFFIVESSFVLFLCFVNIRGSQVLVLHLRRYNTYTRRALRTEM